MQFCSGCAILVGGEDHEVAEGGKRCRWESPLGQIERIVGEKPASDGRRSGARIEDLDPVGGVAILVVKTAGVDGEELVES